MEKTQKIIRNEEYYLEHFSMELISALLKVLVEGLIRTKSIESVEQIPFSISRLLYLASNRSDQLMEREIFEQFCLESNKIMVDEINHFVDKLETFEKIQNLVPAMEEMAGVRRPSLAQQAIGVHNVEGSRESSADEADDGRPQEEAKSATVKSGHKPLTMMQQSALLLQQKQQTE